MIAYDVLKKEIPNVLQSQALARYTTWGLGGPAKYLVEVKSEEEFVNAVQCALRHDIPYLVLGLGSNILFPTTGFRGLVIRNEARHMEIAKESDDMMIVDAGTPLGQVASFARKYSLSGIEFGVGIPGTIAGGVVGNAGMKDSEMKNVVTRVWVIDTETPFGIQELSKADLQFDYRSSVLKAHPQPIVKVELKLQHAELKDIDARMKEWAMHRVERQPVGLKCAGSTFKNPPADGPAAGRSAGKLIDDAGLKNFRIGGAYISEKHANFFINDGTATSDDMIALIKHAQKVVKEKFGVELQPEVRIIS